jgi:hypothetical protein
MPEELMPAIEPSGISAEEPFHARYQIGLRRLGDEVKVISHQAIGVDLPTGLFAGLAQRAEESLAILVIKEDRFTPISPAHQMVDGTGKLNSQWSWHNGQFVPKTIEN